MQQVAFNGVSMNDSMIWATPMISSFFHIHIRWYSTQTHSAKLTCYGEVGLKTNINNTKSIKMM